MSPLLNIQQIVDRQNAVQDLIEHQFELNASHLKMRSLPDLEKLLARIFAYSIKHRIKAIYFEDISLKKLTEFRTLLVAFKRTEEILGTLMKKRGNFTSDRLRCLLTPDNESSDGLFPSRYREALESFERVIVWKRVPGSDAEIPEP